MPLRSTSLKILCVDDNQSFLNLLEILLKEIGIVNVCKANTEEDGLKLYHEFQPDICMVDIELAPGKKNGVDLIRNIREINSMVPVVFLTSYFQERVYEEVKPFKPIAFMNKELSKLKLLQAIELAIYRINLHDELATTSKTADPAWQPTTITSNHNLNSGQLFFKIGDSYKPIETNKITFFYAADKLTYARSEGRNYPTSVQLKVLEDELYPEFLRCHKKYLVNIDQIESILLKEGKVKIGDDLLSIGYAYRKDFLKKINLLK